MSDVLRTVTTQLQLPLQFDTVPAMTWQHPLSLSADEIAQLQQLSKRAADDFARGLLTHAYQAYRLGGLLICVAKYGTELELMAVLQQGATGTNFRAVTRNLRRLADDWNCTAIVTSTTDERVKTLIEALGATVTEWSLKITM